MLPLSADRIRTLYKEAQALHRQGRLAEARQKYAAVLDARPATAEAAYQLGRLDLAEGAPEAALERFARARALKPAEPAIWQAEADAVARTGDAARRTAFLKAAKAARLPRDLLAAVQDRLAPARRRTRADPGAAPPGEIRAAIELLQTGRAAAAEAKAAALHWAHPRVAIVADILASARAAQGRTEAAIAAYETAIALDPDYAEAQANYARLLIDTGAPEAGIARARTALRRAPGMAAAHLTLGRGLVAAGEPAAAAAAFRDALAARPGWGEAQARLGGALMATGAWPEAAAALDRAVAAGGAGPAVQAEHARALAGADRAEEALAAYDRALAAAPDHARLHGERAHLLQRLGRFAEAEAGFRAAIALDPETGEHYRIFAASHRMRPGDPLIGDMQARFDTAAGRDRMELGFALAKAMADTGAEDRVFTYLRPANDIAHAAHPADPDARRAEIDALKAAFDGVDFTREVPGAPDAPGAAPIFVTGMPRSGTTLVEQILASHSRVTAAGETGLFAAAARRALEDGQGGLARADRLADPALAALGQGYAAALRARLPQADRATDKSIQTHLVLGLVRLALPQAHILVMRRDPRDTGLSIYRNRFATGTHRYAYDQTALGRTLAMFDEMVDFWRDRLPGGFHEVHYERLVARPEPEARALVAAAGLDWEAACLNFHENRRRVDTLSLYQVRQPLYAASVGGWRRHVDDLGELLAALDHGGA